MTSRLSSHTRLLHRALAASAFSGNGIEAQPDLVILGVTHCQADLGLLQAVAWIAVASTELLALGPDGVDEPIDEVAGPVGLTHGLPCRSLGKAGQLG